MVLAGSAMAQMKTSADVVKAEPAAGEVSAVAGQRVDFTIKLDIAKKWHIYAHGDTNFIGVDLVPSEFSPWKICRPSTLMDTRGSSLARRSR